MRTAIIIAAIWLLAPLLLLGRAPVNIYHCIRRKLTPPCDHFWICMGADGQGPASWYRYRCEHCGEERLM